MSDPDFWCEDEEGEDVTFHEYPCANPDKQLECACTAFGGVWKRRLPYLHTGSRGSRGSQNWQKYQYDTNVARGGGKWNGSKTNSGSKTEEKSGSRGSDGDKDYGSDGDKDYGSDGDKDYGSDTGGCPGVVCPPKPQCPHGTQLFTTPRDLNVHSDECCDIHVCGPSTCGELEFGGKTDGCCGVPSCELPEEIVDQEGEARGEPASVGILFATDSDDQGITQAGEFVDPLRWGQYVSRDAKGNKLHWKMNDAVRPRNPKCRPAAIGKLEGDCKRDVSDEKTCEGLEDGGDKGDAGNNKAPCTWSTMSLKRGKPGDEFGSASRLEVVLVRDEDDNIFRECQLFYKVSKYEEVGGQRRLVSVVEIEGNVYRDCQACIPGKTCETEITMKPPSA